MYDTLAAAAQDMRALSELLAALPPGPLVRASAYAHDAFLYVSTDGRPASDAQADFDAVTSAIHDELGGTLQEAAWASDRFRACYETVERVQGWYFAVCLFR